MSYENKYNVNSVQKITDDCLPGYTVLEIKRVSDGSRYGHKWKVLLKCPNKNHPAYWTDLQVIKHKHPCRKCIEEAEFLTPRKLKVVMDACAKNNCKFLEVVPYGKQRFQAIVLKVEDKEGYWYEVTLDHLRNRTMLCRFKFENNPYAIHNIHLWCLINRPDYEFIGDSFTLMEDNYLFKYIGDEISLAEEEKTFTSTMKNFIYNWGVHPILKKRRKSYGNTLVELFLKQNNIGFIPEKTWNGLVSKRQAHLFVDFYLPEYNMVIEVDGEQHYYPVSLFGGDETFQYLQENDQIKNDYCNRHNITLLRLPYYTYGSRRKPCDKYKNIIFEWLNKG